MSRYRLSNSRSVLAVSTFLAVILLTLAMGEWPNLYRFAAGGSGAGAGFHTPLRLDDDVMISLRTGYMLGETGKPSMNRTDVAQPSTSYAIPYLYSLLLHGFSRESAIYVYALLGLISVALTMCLIVLYASSDVLGVIVAAALCLTSTHLLYGLGGWDHLFQGLFLTAATCLSLSQNVRPRRAFIVALLLVLGTVFRPDGGLLALGILATLWFSTLRWKVLLSGIIPYIALMGLVLAINYHQFDHVTPTTARLKIGGAPSLGYILHYILANGLLSYSALTLFAGLILLLLAYHIPAAHRQVIPIVIGCVATVSFALYNSDYFPGARMVWSSTCVLGATFAVLAPRTIFPEVQGAKSSWSQASSLVRLILAAYVVVIAVGITAVAMRRRVQEATISSQRAETSPVAQQYVIAHWINSNLQPKDGSIGFFYLGVSYDLPSFEVADFLGKADESIATLKAQQGPPGHNKWDLDRTLTKWKPQAIVPPGPVDPNLPETKENSHKHAPDLLLNQEIAAGFRYCYVQASDLGVIDRWGFFVRKDIAVRHVGELRCSEDPSQKR